MLAQTRAPAPFRGASSRRPDVSANFFGKAKTVTTGRITGRAPRLADPVDLKKTGFRYDAANLRWVRDDRKANEGGMEEITATPISGTSYVVWPVMHTTLVTKGLKSVTPEEAQQLQKQGWTIVDVRLASEYEKEHAEGAVSVPAFRFTAGTSAADTFKKVAMAIGFAMRATERNPEFTQEAAQALGKGSKILVMCSIGGTLDTLLDLRAGVKAPIRDAERSFGRESRALKACYELIKSGWNPNNIFWVDGGLQQWRYNGLPVIKK
ncbi:hypothetical protein HYH03_019042 [Edaphochlamys debaryana]|uniref:Rhodanese domain-containing protein n=1 Tax=Edaphochlamys debaryana TaxID=47281 RepID=A0A836BNR7_9CHLO|nr:hypothetical protein HYH03_019042 [Edaphochlamys debaryana]|eukprot:KAG2482004.1 hypothetical protein HYH03_019042 [Edaphochlamys debaryana]